MPCEWLLTCEWEQKRKETPGDSLWRENLTRPKTLEKKSLIKRDLESGNAVLFQSIPFTPTHFEVIFHN